MKSGVIRFEVLDPLEGKLNDKPNLSDIAKGAGKYVGDLLYRMVPYWGDKYHFKKCDEEPSITPAFSKYGFLAVKYGLVGACAVWDLLG